MPSDIAMNIVNTVFAGGQIGRDAIQIGDQMLQLLLIRSRKQSKR